MKLVFVSIPPSGLITEQGYEPDLITEMSPSHAVGLELSFLKFGFSLKFVPVAIPHGGLRTRRRKMAKIYVSNALSPSHPVGSELLTGDLHDVMEKLSPSHTVGLERYR